MIRICPNGCDFEEVSEDYDFCPDCGEHLEWECEECGRILEDGEDECIRCEEEWYQELNFDY